MTPDPTPTDRNGSGEPTNRFVVEVLEDSRVAVSFEPLAEPDPTLTDDELADMERQVEYLSTHAAMDDLKAGWERLGLDVPRLIAALRASRDALEVETGALLIGAEEFKASQAEVERLRGLLDDVAVELEYAVDPYKAPEQQIMFLRHALRMLGKRGLTTDVPTA